MRGSEAYFQTIKRKANLWKRIDDLLPPTFEIEIPVHLICIKEEENRSEVGTSNQSSEGTVQVIPNPISQKDLKSIISESAAYAKMYGRMPAGLELLVDDLLTPKLSWRELLWRYVTQEFISDYTWASPNRRYVQHGVYLPGVVRGGLDLAVCVDTSGSIDLNTLSEFFAEIRAIAASYENARVHLIECDAEVTGVYEIDERNIKDIKFRGGGGTLFTPALKKASEFNPRVCVYLTDGCGDFPTDEPPFPVIWTLTNRDTETPFGICVVIG